jgi:hypothetical protein
MGYSTPSHPLFKVKSSSRKIIISDKQNATYQLMKPSLFNSNKEKLKISSRSVRGK